jgi:CBS domain containing-hemolysin-like protein
MTFFILGLACALLAIVSASLYRAFSHVTQKELKRRARNGDEVAAILYRSASYGLSTKLVLGSLFALSTYGAFVFMVQALEAWLALPVLVIIAMLGLLFVESKGGANRVSLWLAQTISPVLSWVLERLHPLFSQITRAVRKLFPLRVHSGLYEKEDLVALLEAQKAQPDNRIAPGEIDMLSHALTFGDKTVADALVPKRVVKSVAVDEPVGPVLMGELHTSGHSRFPVYEAKKDNIVGVLYLHDLVATKQSGVVRTVMRRKVTYVHEEFTLYQTLQAFIKTKQHLFVAVNSFEEYVGIITIEDVLERVIGKLIVDEFDTYDDLRAVAAAAARKDHAANVKQHAPETAD